MLFCLAACLSACASKIPLNEPAKVEDRSQSSTMGTIPSRGPDLGSSSQRAVKTIDLSAVKPDMVENTVYFDFDSFIVKPQFQSVLEAQAKRLKANKAVKIYLSGHTDELGGREYNLALGQKRAEAVKRSLTILGIPESQMEAVSFGKEKPAIPGTTEAAGEKNRRVEISNRD